MTGTSTETKQPAPSILGRNRLKSALWAVLGTMTLSVTFYSEVPLLRSSIEIAYLRTILWIIVPHVLCGIAALLIGPLQFSSRLRRSRPRVHRILGRVYVISVFIAAPLAMILSVASNPPPPQRIYFATAIFIQAGTWLVATGAAFVMARNRHFQQHREWMVRSYAVTFTFVATRVLQPIPAWNHHSRAGFAMEIIFITFLAILIPDIALHWRELTTRRA